MRKISPLGVLTAGAAGLILALASPLAATAHDFIVSSTPEDGSIITSLPDTFSVTSSGELLNLAGDGSGFGILVTDSDGLYYGDGCPAVDGPTLSTTAALGKPGDYSFTWQVISSDGHPTSGQLSFTWAPAADAELSAGSRSQPVCGQTVIESLAATETSEPAEVPTTDAEETVVPITAPAAEVPANPAAPWIIGGGVVSILIGISGMVWLWRTKQGPFRNRGL